MHVKNVFTLADADRMIVWHAEVIGAYLMPKSGNYISLYHEILVRYITKYNFGIKYQFRMPYD